MRAFSRVGLSSLLVLCVSCGAGGDDSKASPRERIDDGGASGPGPVSQAPGVAYEGELWTKPSDSADVASTQVCMIRRSVPGCENFPKPSVVAIAIDGQRLAVLVRRDRGLDLDLLVSDDLGETVRRFSLAAIQSNGRDVGLYLFKDRVLILASFDGWPSPFSARVFEVDPHGGAVWALGGSDTMSSERATWTPSDVLTAVEFSNDRAPQVVSLTRFDPATNGIMRTDVPCDVEGCNPDGLSARFVSVDKAASFKLLTSQAQAPSEAKVCLLTYTVDTGSLASQCAADLPTNLTPVRSFGSESYDFAFSTSDLGDVVGLTSLTQNWAPSRDDLTPSTGRTGWIRDSLFLYDPAELDGAVAPAVLRLSTGGELQVLTLPHEGCWTLFGFSTCKTSVVAMRNLPNGDVLVITQHDEFDDPDRSRQLFEISRIKPMVEPFAPPG